MDQALALPRGIGVPFPPREDQFEIFDEVFQRVADGEPLTKIVRDAHMPSVSSLFRWLNADPLAWAAYTRAKETQAHVFASRIVEDAHTTTDAQLGRLRMDALKWAASKMLPKVYGDSTQIKHADADGNKLDTAPLVNELLSVMGSANGSPLTLINVTPDAKGGPHPEGYRPPEERIHLRRSGPRPPPSRAGASDIDDLV